eukprot:6971814-Prymnesium_polylepis.1
MKRPALATCELCWRSTALRLCWPHLTPHSHHDGRGDAILYDESIPYRTTYVVQSLPCSKP